MITRGYSTYCLEICNPRHIADAKKTWICCYCGGGRMRIMYYYCQLYNKVPILFDDFWVAVGKDESSIRTASLNELMEVKEELDWFISKTDNNFAICGYDLPKIIHPNEEDVIIVNLSNDAIMESSRSVASLDFMKKGTDFIEEFKGVYTRNLNIAPRMHELAKKSTLKELVSIPYLYAIRTEHGRPWR